MAGRDTEQQKQKIPEFLPGHRQPTPALHRDACWIHSPLEKCPSFLAFPVVLRVGDPYDSYAEPEALCTTRCRPRANQAQLGHDRVVADSICGREACHRNIERPQRSTLRPEREATATATAIGTATATITATTKQQQSNSKASDCYYPRADARPGREEVIAVSDNSNSRRHCLKSSFTSESSGFVINTKV